MYDHRVGFLQIEQSSFQLEVRQSAVMKWSAGGTVAFLDPWGGGQSCCASQGSSLNGVMSCICSKERRSVRRIN
jgi:hypothetical protein